MIIVFKLPEERRLNYQLINDVHISNVCITRFFEDLNIKHCYKSILVSINSKKTCICTSRHAMLRVLIDSILKKVAISNYFMITKTLNITNTCQG